MTDHSTVPLNKLVRSERNVRKTASTAAIAELAENIAVHGVLQNLVVVPVGKGKYAVTAGGRRLAALEKLAAVKRIPKTYPVPVKITDPEDAIAISLSENAMREQMHPADEFDAFKALIAEGKSAEDVAAQFGVTPAVVTRRLKMAAVAEPILTAFREDRLTLRQVMGFTVADDHDAQVAVFEEISALPYQVSREQIVQRLTKTTVSTDDPRAVFIGADAYIAAGGIITRDLFDTNGTGYCDDSSLLDRLTLEKLATLIPDHLNEGWKWIEPALHISAELTKGMARIREKQRPLSEAEQARHDELVARMHALAERDDDGDEDEYWQLDDEVAAINGQCAEFDPAERALAGGWIALNRDGVPYLTAGYVRSEDIAALETLQKSPASSDADAAHSDTTTTESTTSAEARTATDGKISAALQTDLHAARTVALRLELLNRPDIALRAVAHALALQFITNGRGVLTLHASKTYIPAIAQTHAPSEDPINEKIGHWRLRLADDPATLWDAIMKLSDEDVLDLIATCAANTVDATYQHLPDSYTRHRTACADRLASSLNLDMRQYWTTTAENYLGRVNKAAIAEAVTEAVSPEAADSLAKMKKTEMASEAAKMISGTGWLPTPLRQPT